jgi:hypothetical protein
MRLLFLSVFSLFAVANAHAIDATRCPDRVNLTYAGISPVAVPDSTISSNPSLLKAWNDLKGVTTLHFNLVLTVADIRYGTCTYEGGNVKGLLYSPWGREDVLDLGQVRSKVTNYTNTGITLSQDQDSLSILGRAFFCGAGDCAEGGYPVGHAQSAKEESGFCLRCGEGSGPG